MFHLFINSSVISIASEDEQKYQFLKPFEDSLTVQFTDKTDLLKYISVSETTATSRLTEIITMDVEKTKEQLLNHYKIVPAAGGLVLNEEKQLLMIFRNNRWDLPKGKMEEGEATATTAIREVEEETGVQNLQLNNNLDITFHSFRQDGKRTLKKTHWFLMNTDWKERLIPQQIEGITDAKWVDQSYLMNYLSNSFTSVAELVNRFVLKMNEVH